MAEPQLYQNQPSVEEHLSQHKNETTGVEKLHEEIVSLSGRLKVLEERYTSLRKKTQTSDQNLIESERGINQEIRLLNDDLMALKRKLRELSEKTEVLSDEVDNFVKHEDFIVLDKYISMWQPMEFVTRKELNDILKKK